MEITSADTVSNKMTSIFIGNNVEIDFLNYMPSFNKIFLFAIQYEIDFSSALGNIKGNIPLCILPGLILYSHHF